jgi:hypothetical protein
MNILKTPQQMLLEEAGMTPASPGMLKTPQQLLLEESGVQPKFFSDGGSTTMNVQDMLAALIAAGQEPQRFNNGGQPSPKKSFAKKLIMPGIVTGLLAPSISQAATEAQGGKYGEAAATAALIGSGFLPGPLQALIAGFMPSELGDSTLDAYNRMKAEKDLNQRFYSDTHQYYNTR